MEMNKQKTYVNVFSKGIPLNQKCYDDTTEDCTARTST